MLLTKYVLVSVNIISFDEVPTNTTRVVKFKKDLQVVQYHNHCRWIPHLQVDEGCHIPVFQQVHVSDW